MGVVALDSEGIKVAKVLMVREEILGVDEVTGEEDVVMVVEGSKKQTLWLTGITASWYKDSGAQGLARQGSYIGT